jgi:mRNA interferase RelE/StbE
VRYRVTLKPKAEKDLKEMPTQDRKRLVERLRLLEEDLSGDVKRLTNHHPEYRMRSGDWRALFEIADSEIIVYRILHRKEAYRS